MPPVEEYTGCAPEDLLTLPLPDNKLSETTGPASVSAPEPAPSLDFNDNEDLPTELSDSSETHDEGTQNKTFPTEPNYNRGLTRVCSQQVKCKPSRRI